MDQYPNRPHVYVPLKTGKDIEGVDINSTGEVGGVKVLTEDGTGGASWEAISALEISGQYLGSSNTFAGLPTPPEASSGDWAALTAEDGVNLPGIYVYNGTVFSFVIQIANPFTLDTSAFSGNLIGTDDTLQKVADKFDTYTPSLEVTEYLPTVDYVVGDIANENGELYRTKFGNGPSSIVRTPSISPNQWELIASPNFLEKSDLIKIWEAFPSFNIGEMVFYNGNIYISLINSNQNDNPETFPASWRNITDVVPITAATASALTPVEGMDIFVSDTDVTFTDIGRWSYSGGSWSYMETQPTEIVLRVLPVSGIVSVVDAPEFTTQTNTDGNMFISSVTGTAAFGGQALVANNIYVAESTLPTSMYEIVPAEGQYVYNAGLDLQMRYDGFNWVVVSPDQTVVLAGNYTVLTTDNLILKTAITAAGDTITLPSNAYSGQQFTIKDSSGNAGTDNITIGTAGTETIDASATVKIIVHYGAVTVIFDGSNYHITNVV